MKSGALSTHTEQDQILPSGEWLYLPDRGLPGYRGLGPLRHVAPRPIGQGHSQGSGTMCLVQKARWLWRRGISK